MGRNADFLNQMTKEQIDELKELARHDGKTNVALLAWLTEIGVKTSQEAVRRWRERFEITDHGEELIAKARAIIDLGKEDTVDVVDAAYKHVAQICLEQSMAGDRTDLSRVDKVLGLLQKLTRGKQELEELKQLGREQFGAIAAQITKPDEKQLMEAAIKRVFG